MKENQNLLSTLMTILGLVIFTFCNCLNNRIITELLCFATVSLTVVPFSYPRAQVKLQHST